MISQFQNVLAVTLAILTGAVVGFQASFVIINILLFMELFQFETSLYILIYVPITVGLTLIWVALHHYFVRRYKPDEYGDDHNRVTSTELSRASSLQFMMVSMSIFVVAAGLVFESRFPGDIAPGDGHIVQNGMDTKSAIYTMWLVILITVFIGGTYIVTHAVYLFDLYLTKFRKSFKDKE